MGSSQFEGLDAIGILRGGGAEPCHGPPEAFTIVGLDISAEKLIALYSETKGKPGEAHERARKLIMGARDMTRADDIDPPPEFVASIGAEGIAQRIVCANLGPDRKGKPWVVTIAGRKRNVGARKWNGAHPADAVEMLAELKGFKNTATIDAELAALDLNSASNIFVGMRPSQMADHAAMHTAKGRPPAIVALKIGARDAEHVALLLALAECAPEVKASVDANVTPLADCRTLSTLPADEQARRIARKTAPSRKAADAAAPPRPRARAASLARSVADALVVTSHGRPVGTIEGVSDHAAALAAWFAGRDDALDGHPKLKKAVESAGWTAKVTT